MFSGIVDSATVEKMERQEKDMRLFLSTKSAEEASIGDSISINGVCLTVVEKSGSILAFDVMNETLEKSNLASLSPGERVNMELSLRLTDRLGGHFVMGHIDGTGALESQEPDGNSVKIWFSVPETLTKYMIPKGAVSLDGISMTLVDVEKTRFSVCVIPHTQKVTTLGSKKPGDVFNIEVDMIGKFIKKHLEELEELKS